ncbi:DUF4299 family protein [uncultured Campylobacter sp.]|uniref:DUF4299 family protein n=1 Tax=uncultured Campylobacter sp. TaxID=218934 RepID=UPI0026347A7B|nr:DUF4299 family protein [uncultured Campylobacter sp.]
MSVEFRVKNKKRPLFMGYSDVMSVSEALDLLPDLSVFGIDESAEDFDERAFLKSLLSEHECLILGVRDKSGRGMELRYDEEQQSYAVRVNTPATVFDWVLAISYLQALSKQLGGEITDENGEIYDHDKIEQFDYERDIAAGLHSIDQHLNGDTEVNFCYGVERPFAINRAMMDEILASYNPAAEFSKRLTEVQYLDAYSAHQRFYRNGDDGTIMGSYALTQDLPTILPYKPFVEWQNAEMLKNSDVARWQIALIGIEGDENDAGNYRAIAELEYGEFIARLPKQNYRFIDASYILVDGLNVNQLKALAG